MSGGSLEFFLAGTSTPTNLFSDNAGTSIGTSITLNSGGYPEVGGNVITLFRDSSIAIKIVARAAPVAPATTGDVIWTADGLKDSLVLLASTANAEGASLVGVEDTGAFFTGTELEAVTQDIGATYLKNTVDRTGITATYTFASGGVIAMADQEIRRSLLVDYSVKGNSVSSVSGTLTVDFEIGQSFSTTLTENTTIALINPPAAPDEGELTLRITQDGAGGAFTITLPASVEIPGGVTYTMTVTNNARDKLTFSTIDAGTVYDLEFSQAYA